MKVASGQITSEISYTYDAGGRLLNMKSINTSFVSNDTYTYDANGWLVKKVVTYPSNKTEFLFTNNSVHGQPEKMAQYTDGKLMSITDHFYQ